MGNRAVITTNENLKEIGIYLHWNGGRDSIEGFLAYCKLRGYRSPKTQKNYAMARLTAVIANFFGGGLSIGIDIAENLDCDNWDNGVYIIGGDWEIVGRMYNSCPEQQSYDLIDTMVVIDEAQPNPLGENYIRAKVVDPQTLSVGDKIYFNDGNGNVTIMPIVGIIKEHKHVYVNGEYKDIYNIPYIDRFGGAFGVKPSENTNNYITFPVRKFV